MDLQTGVVTDQPESPQAPLHSYATEDGGWLDVQVTYNEEHVPSVEVQRWDAFNRPIALNASPDLVLRRPSPARLDTPAISPDGKWLALATDMNLPSPAMTQVWPAVILVDLQSQRPVIRSLRSALVVGLTQLQWLADSSGVVVATADGFALLRTVGTLTLLPFGPVEQSGVNGVPVPIPAPHDPDLFVYASRVVDTSGQTIGPDNALRDWRPNQPFTNDGLNAAGTELRLVRYSPPGRDWGVQVLTAFKLSARVEFPPFDTTILLKIAAGGDGVNVRSAPNADAEIVGSLPDNITVAVTVDESRATSAEPDEALADPNKLFWIYDVPWWVHVKTEDGLQGWVRSEFVTWPE